MMTEISEQDATGDIAAIFAEVRLLWGVPYVSAIHRHLATRPGVLEWAWAAVGPSFRDGRAQEAGWRCADGLALRPLAPISQHALGVWGLDAAAVATARAVCDGFVRVAPVNMMFAGLVKALLEGAAPGGGPARTAPWPPPEPLPVPPPMVAPEALDDAGRGVLMQFASKSDGRLFVPGLYRMLARWPGMLAHLATVLGPRLDDAEMRAACDRLRQRIDAAVPGVLATLPALPADRPMPCEAEREHFLAIGATYRKTSPELVVLGRLIRDALGD
jgi:hypothetical protein